MIENFLKKIGNVVATILLGETRDRIIEMGKDIEYIKKDVDAEIKPTLKEISEKVIVLWADRLAVSHSPIRLNQKGQEILEQSGIKQIIDERIDSLLKELEDKKPLNAYQVQEFAKDVISAVKNDPVVLLKLEQGAFRAGVDTDSLLFVGAIYFRDLALPKFNCRLEEIDNIEK